MTQLPMFAALLGLCAALAAWPARTRRPVAWLCLAVGVAVFAVRLHHEGPYAFPERRNLAGGLLCLALGAALAGPWLAGARARSLGTRLALAAAPIPLFFGLYAVLAELEEVVVLRAEDAGGTPRDLRLWVVDREGAAWVNMPRWKADAHGLDGAEVVLLRHGRESCVVATRFAEREQVDAVHHARHEKYAVQRLATRIGMFGRDGDPDNVSLRLTPCEPVGDAAG